MGVVSGCEWGCGVGRAGMECGCEAWMRVVSIGTLSVLGGTGVKSGGELREGVGVDVECGVGVESGIGVGE